MRKIIILLIVVILICGCSKTEPNMEVKTIKPKKEEVVPLYSDLNTTPIGLYQLNGNNLVKYTTINKTPVIEEDLGVFQVYPSNEDKIVLYKNFGEAYHDEWIKYNNIKLGFNIKFHLNTGEDVSYNILNPDDCMKRWEHLMNYLYDDYANIGKGFYSHIESKDYNSNTLFTAIKLQSSYQVGEIDSKIQLTVFTYDTEDDFDEEGNYRGNSSYSIEICDINKTC